MIWRYYSLETSKHH